MNISLYVDRFFNFLKMLYLYKENSRLKVSESEEINKDNNI